MNESVYVLCRTVTQSVSRGSHRVISRDFSVSTRSVAPVAPVAGFGPSEHTLYPSRLTVALVLKKYIVNIT